MCEQCYKIGEEIRRARRFAGDNFDLVTTARIRQLILDLDRRKAALDCRMQRAATG
jgi:hypothetical protein